MPDQQVPLDAALPPPRRFFLALLLLTALTAALVNAGNMGSIDPARRLQQAHSWWTGEPEVSTEPHDRGFGAPDPRGRMRSTFGMGHGLVLLPADLMASGLLRLAGMVHPLDRTLFNCSAT